jgi:polysaccharide biosynthesis protein PslG
MRRVARGALAAALAAATGAALAAIGPASALGAPKPPSPEFYGITPATPLDASEAEWIARAGTGTIRAPFYWPAIEPDPPAGGDVLPMPGGEQRAYQWGPIDELVRRSAENGMRVFPFVYGTPDWIASDPMRPPLGESARGAWQDLLRALVGRYGPEGGFWTENPEVPKVPIESWQLWNEENSADFWSPAPSPAEYAELVQLSDAAIRLADPNADIVLGGMFGTPREDIAAWDFLEGLYEVEGIEASFDAYALHPYSPGIGGIEAQIRLARKEVRAAGDRRLPLLISETGWPTDGPRGYSLVKSPAGQKRMLVKSFRLFLAERRRWNLRGVIWYTWRDNDVQPHCTICSYSGLVDRDLDPKPAWAEFARFAGGRP